MIDAATSRVVKTIRIGDASDNGVLRAHGCAPGTVHSAPDGSFSVRNCDMPSAVVFAEGSVWVMKDDEPAVLEMDPVTYAVRMRIPLDIRPFLMAAASGSMWVTDYEHGALSRIDLARHSVVTTLFGLSPGPAGVAAGPEGTWVTNRTANMATHIDQATNGIVAVVAVGGSIEEVPLTGGSPLALTLADGSVWIKNENAGTVSRIDPVSNRVIANIKVGPKEGRDGVDTLAADGPYIWVTGMRMQRIDSRTNAVDMTLPQDATTITAAGDSTLWITDTAGRVKHFRPASTG